MAERLQSFSRAADLPQKWDLLAKSYVQRREFLAHTERYNPCQQRYHVLECAGQAVAGACVYSLRLDLLTFARIPSPVRINFLGVPCSVSAPGIVGAEEHSSKLIARLLDVERGLFVGLNLDAPVPIEGLLSGRTLPTVVLDLGFPSWEAYRSALRSAYRRRLDRALLAWKGVTSERGSCARMDRGLYRQYLEVHGKSNAKLERLSLEFFQHLPPAFHLTVHRRETEVLGWHIGLTEGRHRSFFLAGVDYTTLEEGRNYQNLLAKVVREAIEDGAVSLDLGQTAEVPKTRLGGKLVEKALFGWSSNPAMRWLLARGRGLLEYRVKVPPTHVFKREELSPAGSTA